MEKTLRVDDVHVDLTEFHLEGEVNAYYSRRGNPIRIRCRWLTDDVLQFELRGYCLALYVKSIDKLFKVDANNIQWSCIGKAKLNR